MLTVLVLLGGAPGCGEAPPPVAPEAYLAVMSAFPPELTRLLAEADIGDTVAAGEATCYVGTLEGLEVVFVLSGIGLEQAAATTRAVLDSFTVSGIVFSGIAGGINPALNIGDVAVPSRWGHADGDAGPGEEGFWLSVDDEMLRIAAEVSESVALADSTPGGIRLSHEPAVIVGGNGVSNSFFVDDREYRDWLWETFQANAVDMETAAVARVAAERGIPFIAFRSLSDLAGGGPGANEVRVFFRLAADNAAAVVIAFLDAMGRAGTGYR